MKGVEGMKYQYFDGLRFTRDDKTGYYQNSTIGERIHRYIYKHYNGEIPKGYQIHHIDRNKSNNDITNLVIISHTEHATLHGNERAKEYYDEMVKNLNENARPKANEWHGSEEGREWHKEHYENMKDKLYVEEEYTCEHCGHKYTGVKNGANRFCSNKCKSAHRRASGIDNEERTCIQCGQKYITNKYSKGKTCSKSCSNKKML